MILITIEFHTKLTRNFIKATVLDLDHVGFGSAWAEFTDGRRTGYSMVAGQASGYAPKVAAQYNGGWTLHWDREPGGLRHGAVALVYSVTDTGSYIRAVFYHGTRIAGDRMVVFEDVIVNALGKFERRYAEGALIEGSFFGGDADEIGGIFDYGPSAGGRVLGAFGVNFWKER